MSLSKHALAPPRTGTQGAARTKPDDSLVGWSKGALEGLIDAAGRLAMAVVRQEVNRKVRVGGTGLAHSGKTVLTTDDPFLSTRRSVAKPRTSPRGVTGCAL